MPKPFATQHNTVQQTKPAYHADYPFPATETVNADTPRYYKEAELSPLSHTHENSFVVALQSTIATVGKRVSIEGEFELLARTSRRSHWSANARSRSRRLAVCDRGAWIVKVLELGMTLRLLFEFGDTGSLCNGLISMTIQLALD